jgi:hypothetical protein
MLRVHTDKCAKAIWLEEQGSPDVGVGLDAIDCTCEPVAICGHQAGMAWMCNLAPHDQEQQHLMVPGQPGYVGPQKDRRPGMPW